MKRDIDSEYFLIDGQIKECDCPNFDDGKRKIYEVMRLINSKPLFFDEHMDRLNMSLESLDCDIKINPSEIISYIEALTNGEVVNRNIKLVVIPIGEELKVYAYFSKSSYPDEEIYSLGIRTDLFKEERENPNVKVLNMDYKKRIENFRASKGIYEAILVDRGDYVTEGSKSNLFFVNDGHVFTPRSKDVLMGITRMKVIEAICNLNLKYHELDISVKEIKNFDGAYITGTSIGVLPIHSIGDISLKSEENKTIIDIRSEYERIVTRNIVDFEDRNQKK